MQLVRLEVVRPCSGSPTVEKVWPIGAAGVLATLPVFGVAVGGGPLPWMAGGKPDVPFGVCSVVALCSRWREVWVPLRLLSSERDTDGIGAMTV